MLRKNRSIIKVIIQFFLSIGLCLFAGVIGSYVTISEIPIWYAHLLKPSFTPSPSVFAPVSTVLYVLMGISLFFILLAQTKRKKNKDAALSFFLVQLILNIFWSIIFFRLHSVLFAFLEIVVLLLMILCSMFYAYKISKPAALLLFPYFLWVSFATVLSFFIVALNS